MKKIICGILTFFVMILLTTFILTMSTKKIIVATTANLIKEEMTKSVVEMLEESTKGEISEEAVEKVEKVIQNNQDIQNILDTSFDKILDILSDKEENQTIDVEKELNKIIDDSEKILQEYDITITEKDKEELRSIASSKELETLVNDTVKDAKENLNEDMKKTLEIYNFVSSTTFKTALIIGIVICLVFIALLQKSTYSWLGNFSVASLSIGILFLLLPFGIDFLLSGIEDGFTLDVSSLKNSGLVLLILGVISLMIKITIAKILTKKTIE